MLDEIFDILKPVGEMVSGWTQSVLGLLPSNLLESSNTARIVSIMIYLGLIWAIARFASSVKKPIKYAIIGLFILLILSVISTYLGA